LCYRPSTLQIQDERIPLAADSEGVLYVAGTRTPLECIIEMFEDGASAEEIAAEYDALNLDVVYAVITYLLRHPQEVRAYLERRQRSADVGLKTARANFPESLRAKLLSAWRTRECGDG